MKSFGRLLGNLIVIFLSLVIVENSIWKYSLYSTRTYYGFSEGKTYLIYNGEPYEYIIGKDSNAVYEKDIAIMYSNDRYLKGYGWMISFFSLNAAVQFGFFYNYSIPYMFFYDLERVGDFNEIVGE